MNIIETFVYLTGLTPTEDEKKLLNELVSLKSKYILIRAGRQTGKTLCCAVAIFHFCFELKKPMKILVVAIDDEKTGEAPIYSKVKELWKKHPEYHAEVLLKGDVLYKGGFQTISGTYVYAKNAVEAKVRGTSADIVFVDEAGLLKNDVIMSAYDCLSGELAKFVVLSTPPKSTIHVFNKWCEDPEKEGFLLFQWSEEQCPWHSATELAFKKRNYSSQWYKTEVQGMSLDRNERTFFMFLDDQVKELEPERVGNEKSIIQVGVDWGLDPCPTVVTVIERLGIKRKVLLTQEWLGKLPEEFIPELVAIIQKYQTRGGLILCDDMPKLYHGLLEKYRIYPKYIVCAEHKSLMLAQLQQRFHVKAMIISDVHTKLVEQLRKYHPFKRTGDDYVDSLAFACYEPSIPFDSAKFGRACFVRHDED